VALAYVTSPISNHSRKTWDKAEYEARAKQRDEEERERMKEADEALQKGPHLIFPDNRKCSMQLVCDGSANKNLYFHH
jgi:hypothetical protein